MSVLFITFDSIGKRLGILSEKKNLLKKKDEPSNQPHISSLKLTMAPEN